MEGTEGTNNMQKGCENLMENYNYVKVDHHENYLEVERTFYEFLNDVKNEGVDDNGDFCSVFIYL